MRKNILLLSILIGATLSNSHATDGSLTNREDLDIIRAQNRAYVESLYNDSVAKDNKLIALQSQLDTAKTNLQASQDHLGQFPDNPKLQAQLAQNQEAFNKAQEQYTTHHNTLMAKFKASCVEQGHANLGLGFACESLEPKKIPDHSHAPGIEPWADETIIHAAMKMDTLEDYDNFSFTCTQAWKALNPHKKRILNHFKIMSDTLADPAHPYPHAQDFWQAYSNDLGRFIWKIFEKYDEKPLSPISIENKPNVFLGGLCYQNCGLFLLQARSLLLRIQYLEDMNVPLHHKITELQDKLKIVTETRYQEVMDTHASDRRNCSSFRGGREEQASLLQLVPFQLKSHANSLSSFQVQENEEIFTTQQVILSWSALLASDATLIHNMHRAHRFEKFWVENKGPLKGMGILKGIGFALRDLCFFIESYPEAEFVLEEGAPSLNRYLPFLKMTSCLSCGNAQAAQTLYNHSPNEFDKHNLIELTAKATQRLFSDPLQIDQGKAFRQFCIANLKSTGGDLLGALLDSDEDILDTFQGAKDAIPFVDELIAPHWGKKLLVGTNVFSTLPSFISFYTDAGQLIKASDLTRQFLTCLSENPMTDANMENWNKAFYPVLALEGPEKALEMIQDHYLPQDSLTIKADAIHALHYLINLGCSEPVCEEARILAQKMWGGIVHDEEAYAQLFNQLIQQGNYEFPILTFIQAHLIFDPGLATVLTNEVIQFLYQDEIQNQAQGGFMDYPYAQHRFSCFLKTKNLMQHRGDCGALIEKIAQEKKVKLEQQKIRFHQIRAQIKQQDEENKGSDNPQAKS